METRSLSTTTRCLGIDVSTLRQSREGRTLAVIAEIEDGVFCVREVRPLLDDEAFLHVLTEAPFLSCGLDLALTLPPCLMASNDVSKRWEEKAVEWGLSVETFYHYRPEDWLLRKMLPGIAPKPPISNGGPIDLTPLTLRWLRLKRQLDREQRQLAPLTEVYASAAIELLAKGFGFESRKRFPYRSSEEFRAQWPEELCRTQQVVIPDTLWSTLISSDDPLDALTCGWVAWRASLREGLRAQDWLAWEGGFGWKEAPELSLEAREWLDEWWRKSPSGVLPDPRAVFERFQSQRFS